MKAVAARYPADDTIHDALRRGADGHAAVGLLGGGRRRSPRATAPTSCARSRRCSSAIPAHPGAIHLYIHAVEASTSPRSALPHARRLAALDARRGAHRAHAGAHLLPRGHVPRVARRQQAARSAVDERYFKTSPSDPLYKVGVLPAQHPLRDGVGADGRRRARRRSTRRRKLDASIPVEVAKQFAIMQPVKAAPYTTHAQFSDPRHDPRAARAAGRPRAGARRCTTTRAPWPCAAQGRRPRRSARSTRSRRSSSSADFKPFAEWQVPAKEIVQTARLVATGRLADAKGDLDARRQGLRGRDLHRGHARLHGAAVLVLPGAPVARLGAPAPGQARRRGEGVPRFARARAQQRLGARRARRGVPPQGRRQGRGRDAARLPARGSDRRRGPIRASSERRR